MRNTKPYFTPIERLMVLAILLFLAAIAVQNVALSLKDSEDQTVKAAKVEYAGVRNMYAGQNRVGPSVEAGRNSAGVTVASNAQNH